MILGLLAQAAVLHSNSMARDRVSAALQVSLNITQYLQQIQRESRGQAPPSPNQSSTAELGRSDEEGGLSIGSPEESGVAFVARQMNRRRANTTSAEMEEGKNDLRSAALPSAAPAADEEAAGPKDEVRNPTQHSSEAGIATIASPHFVQVSSALTRSSDVRQGKQIHGGIIYIMLFVMMMSFIFFRVRGPAKEMAEELMPPMDKAKFHPANFNGLLPSNNAFVTGKFDSDGAFIVPR
jgi:hypothetical protein